MGKTTIKTGDNMYKRSNGIQDVWIHKNCYENGDWNVVATWNTKKRGKAVNLSLAIKYADLMLNGKALPKN